MFLVNVRPVRVMPRVVDAKQMQSKLNLDFIKFTNDLFYIISMLKSPHSRIGISVSGFMFGKIDCFLGPGSNDDIMEIFAEKKCN
jgi:hypothetical protein